MNGEYHEVEYYLMDYWRLGIARRSSDEPMRVGTVVELCIDSRSRHYHHSRRSADA